MGLRKIAQLGEPVLRQRAAAIDPADLSSLWFRALVDDMVATMRDADGVGIAAPQVFEPLRVCLVVVRGNPRYPSFGSVPLTVFVNPELEVESPTGAGQSIAIYEGCLSVAGLRGRVERPRKVKIRALDLDGRAFETLWEGPPAAIIQHEVDHLNGTLIVDRADPKTLAFLREYERHVPMAERVVDGS